MLSFIELLKSKKVAPYVFVSFPIILIFSLIGYPVIDAFRISLLEYKLLSKNTPFRGLSNYIELFSDRIFLNAFKNTIVFAIAYVVIGLIIGLLLALVIHHLPNWIQNIVKAVSFLPVIVSMVPVAIAFKWLLRSGPEAPINYYMSFIGIKPVGWLTDISWALPSVIGVTLWKNAGFIMIIYLAGLLNIPSNYYEAAKIDGAGPWGTFWRITLPLLKNTTVFLMVTGFIGSFQAFTQVLVLTGGSGPDGSTSTLGYEIFKRAFDNYDMGSASAMGFVMFFFILIVTIFQLRYFGGEKSEK